MPETIRTWTTRDAQQYVLSQLKGKKGVVTKVLPPVRHQSAGLGGIPFVHCGAGVDVETKNKFCSASLGKTHEVAKVGLIQAMRCAWGASTHVIAHTVHKAVVATAPKAKVPREARCGEVM